MIALQVLLSPHELAIQAHRQYMLASTVVVRRFDSR
jgi:hypothetical protein